MFDNKALIHLNYQWQHSLQSSIPINKTCRKWDMTLSSQWQWTRSCVTYMMQEWYQWKEDELLFTHRPQPNIKMNWLRTMGLWIWITFFWYALYMWAIYELWKSSKWLLHLTIIIKFRKWQKYCCNANRLRKSHLFRNLHLLKIVRLLYFPAY